MKAVSLVLGGHGPDALAATVSSLASTRVWCFAVGDDEAAAIAGLARIVQTHDSVADTTEPLLRLVSAAEADLRDADSVVLIRAGTRFRRGGLDRALRAIERGAGVVLPARSRPRALLARTTLRLHRRATLVPPSGMVVSPRAFGSLLSAGAFAADGLCTIRDVARLAGTPDVVVSTMRRKRRRRQKGLRRRSSRRPVSRVAVVVPAHNEEAWIGHTLRSLFDQTRMPDEIIVVDDGSEDRTGEIARRLGARVIRPAVRQGRKAAAVNVGLQAVTADAVVIVDADTILDRNAIQHLLDDLERGYDATGGAVRPMDEGSVWARGRAVQYALAARFFKPLQRDLRSVLVISGCISCYRTDALRAIGGLSDRTVGEDLDATWELYLSGGAVGFTPKAVALTIEPPSFRFYRSQIRRWAAGLYQAMHAHRLGLRRHPALAFYVLTVLWDLITAPLGMLAIPALVLMDRIDPRWLALVAVLNGITLGIAFRDLGVRRTIRSLPAFFMMLWVDLYFYSEAMVRELFLRRGRLAWEKGRV